MPIFLFLHNLFENTTFAYSFVNIICLQKYSMEEGRDSRERSFKNGGEEKTVGMDIRVG
jgi:hypothetical protein